MEMRKFKLLSLVLVLAMVLGMLAGCSQSSQPAEPSQLEKQEQPEEGSQGSDQIADASEKTAAEDVVDESYVPIYAESIKNGTYEIQVDSSSSMFNIVNCVLTVADDGMTADMTMGGTGYRYIYMGTPEEAVAASDEDYILPQEDASGAHHYIVPVEALDAGIDCAAFSNNKEKWYDRILVFRSKDLAMSDYEPGFLTTAEKLGLADGSYTCEVTLSGGSGKASVSSPANIIVENGAATAEIVWSSDKYDYMKIDGEQYLPVNTSGNSTFLIPLAAFDFNLPVLADTIAMSTPHEIEYTLNFDSSTIQ